MILFLILSAAIFILFQIVFGKKNNPEETKSKTIQIDRVGDFMSDFEVVGVHVDDRKWYIVNYVVEHNPVELIPEPDNKFSKEAIKVMVNDFHCGYISEGDVQEVHDIISRPYLARVLAKDFTGGYLTLKIEINHS